jgi:hypothetical protein
MVKCCVFFAVRTEFLNIIQASFGFKRLVVINNATWRQLPAEITALCASPSSMEWWDRTVIDAGGRSAPPFRCLLMSTHVRTTQQFHTTSENFNFPGKSQNSTDQIYTAESNSRSRSEKIIHLYETRRLNTRCTDNSLQMVPILSQRNRVHTLTSILILSSHRCLGLSSSLFP